MNLHIPVLAKSYYLKDKILVKCRLPSVKYIHRDKMKKAVKRTLIVFTGLVLLTSFLLFYYSVPPDRALFIDPIHRLNTDDRLVALTFDDGPSPVWTPLLLNLLKKHSVKGTFFMVGRRILENLEIAKLVVSEGHEVGYHTMEHSRMIFRSQRFIENDIKEMNRIFSVIGAEEVCIYRPPYGNKLISLPLVLKRLDIKMITWDVDPEDQYDRDNMDSALISSCVLGNVSEGSIILLHDGWSGDPEPFLNAIELMINGLKKKGYSFVTISEGLLMCK